MRIFYYLFFLVSTNIFSQNIQGILYDSEGDEVANFDIRNKTKELTKKTNHRGYFEIEADIGDSIIFHSITYREHILLASTTHFKETIVVELKTEINELNEVKLTGPNKEFDLKEFNEDFQLMIENDRKKHPYLYEKVPSSQGNLFALVGTIYQKFFKKEQPEKIEKITFRDFKELFEADDLINNQFLIKELNIPLELKTLFFDYLDSLSWNAELLDERNKLSLIQKLYRSSSDYLKIIRSSEL